MHAEEPQSAPPTEGQTIPPEEQIIPTAGLVQEDEQTQGEQAQSEDRTENVAGQAQSLASSNPMPIGLAVAFVAGVVVGRIASRR
jgi:ElaB/YqjD/DUF883 family membrane-anchored ribosome-binding protein